MTARTVRNLIDGSWVESVTGRILERRNPADVREVREIALEELDLEYRIRAVDLAAGERCGRLPGLALTGKEEALAESGVLGLGVKSDLDD